MFLDVLYYIVNFVIVLIHIFDKYIAIDEINPCNHEEADTWMLLHVAHASAHGHQKVSIRTLDTDVIVLAVSQFQHLQLAEIYGLNLELASITGLYQLI